ncbi:MAG: hypothetical protein M3380_16080, partial [Chloroflexota bacterium]|nr:hypothetical protein [Chloroflexota bacterium]
MPDRARMATDAAAQIARLRQLLGWLISVAFGFALVEAIAFVVFRDVPTGIAALILLFYGGWLVVAWMQVQRGSWRTAIGTICFSLLGGTITAVPVQPTWAPTLAVLPLLTVAVALPYTNGRLLRRLIVVCWL